MAFDGIVISNLTHELNTALASGRISKIAMPENNELLITVKNNSTNYRLLISADASLPLMYLLDYNKQSPLTAPGFCMLLRKHIGSARILGIEQIGLERIIKIRLEHLNELGDICNKNLYIELMGKYSNIIFTDDQDMIIDSIKHITAQISSVREILPGRQYSFPNQLMKTDPLSMTYESFEKGIKQNDIPVAKALYTSLSGLSPVVAEEICYRADIDSAISSAMLSDQDIKKLYNSISVLMDDIRSYHFEPHIILRDGDPDDYSSITLSCIENSSSYSIRPYDSVSTMLYDFYSLREAKVRMKQKSVDIRKSVNTALERAQKKYDLQTKQLKDTLKKDKYKVYGDMLHTYGYTLTGGEKELICENYYDDNKSITIPLDSTLSAADNAKKYYDRYTKLKRTEEAMTIELKKTDDSINHLRTILVSLDIATDEADLTQIKEELSDYGYIKKHTSSKKQQQSKSKPLHYQTKDGIDIYVGKNNYQNEELTFKLASGNDWWFHAKGIPGSHVIVKSSLSELPDDVYEIASSLAAYYSDGRDSDKVEVDYIQKKNLKKVAGAAPGFVIYHTNWSMVAIPTIDDNLILLK